MALLTLLSHLQVGRLIDATSSFELEASEYQRKGVSNFAPES